jgi:hypothetical protein
VRVRRKINSPAQRSLALLREQGYSAQITEHWNPFAHIRQDLFGFLDIIGIKSGVTGVLGIQTTSTGNLSARVKKILAIPEAQIWLSSGGKILVHGWSKKGKAGKRKLWQLTEKELTLADFKSE